MSANVYHEALLVVIREMVIRLMVNAHDIPPSLARIHANEMTAHELVDRVAMYARNGVAL